MKKDKTQGILPQEDTKPSTKTSTSIATSTSEEKSSFLSGFFKKERKPATQEVKTLQTGEISKIEKENPTQSLTGKGVKPPKGVEGETIESTGAERPWTRNYGSTFKVYKRTIRKSLIIFLIENTKQMKKEESIIARIVSGTGKSDLACIVNYGMHVMETEPFEISWLKSANLLLEDDMGDEVHLYDALAEIKRLVTLYAEKETETDIEKVVISGIEIIGIGTCKENGSEVSKDFGIDCFSEISKNPKIITKYFCFTEESFLTAAEIGFRSIGSISQKYT